MNIQLTPVLIAALYVFPALAQTARQPFGVCPPFPLRDEAGAVINPGSRANSTAPYSPKQTCGAKGSFGSSSIIELMVKP
jgi:hypothetical protein